MRDDEPRNLAPAPPALDRLSEAELRERIDALRGEIAACEAELARKQAVRRAADALFGGAGRQDLQD